jgi:hypothetical protein
MGSLWQKKRDVLIFVDKTRGKHRQTHGSSGAIPDCFRSRKKRGQPTSQQLAWIAWFQICKMTNPWFQPIQFQTSPSSSSSSVWITKPGDDFAQGVVA